MKDTVPYKCHKCCTKLALWCKKVQLCILGPCNNIGSLDKIYAKVFTEFVCLKPRFKCATYILKNIFFLHLTFGNIKEQVSSAMVAICLQNRRRSFPMQYAKTNQKKSRIHVTCHFPPVTNANRHRPSPAKSPIIQSKLVPYKKSPN